MKYSWKANFFSWGIEKYKDLYYLFRILYSPQKVKSKQDKSAVGLIKEKEEVQENLAPLVHGEIQGLVLSSCRLPSTMECWEKSSVPSFLVDGEMREVVLLFHIFSSTMKHKSSVPEERGVTRTWFPDGWLSTGIYISVPYISIHHET